MRFRLYFLLPDLASARRVANDLLLARVEDRHMHFLAKRGTDYGELHEASVLQKTDLVHGGQVGLGVGAALGALVGGAAVMFAPEGAGVNLVAMLIGTLIGAMLGAWVASMIGSQVGNSRLKAFAADIEAGRMLLMVDVPMGRTAQIRDLVAARHPDAVSGGQAASMPAFP